MTRLIQLFVETSDHISPSFPSIQFASSQILGSGIGFGAEISRGGAGLREEAGKDGLDEGSEYDLGSIGLGEGHPQDEDEFEGVVESCQISAAEHHLCSYRG